MNVIPIQFREEEDLMRTVISILNQRYDWLPMAGIYESRKLRRTTWTGGKVHITSLAIAPQDIHATINLGEKEGEYGLCFYQDTPSGQLTDLMSWSIKYPKDSSIWAAHEIADLIALTFYYERGFFDEAFISTWDLEHPLSDHIPTGLLLPNGEPNQLVSAQMYWDYRTKEKDDVPTQQDSGGTSP